MPEQPSRHEYYSRLMQKTSTVPGMGKMSVPKFGKPRVGVMNHYTCWQYHNFGWFRREYDFFDKLV